MDGNVMKVTAIARHPAVLRYHSDSGARFELVTPEFIKALDAEGTPFIAQLGEAPVTHEHPKTLIRTDSATGEEYYQVEINTDAESQNGKVVGAVDPTVKVFRSGRVQVLMDVEDPITQDAIRNGEKRGVSLGYSCGIVAENGVWQGKNYTHKQVSPIRIDHLAIVANPRAPEALITRFDSTEDVAWAIYDDDQAETTPRSVPTYDGDDDCECKKCKSKSKKDDSMTTTIAPEHLKERIVFGGATRRVDSGLFNALKQEGLIEPIRLDGSEFYAGLDFIEALHEDGVIQPENRNDAPCGRGWTGNKPGCKRAGKGGGAKTSKARSGPSKAAKERNRTPSLAKGSSVEQIERGEKRKVTPGSAKAKKLAMANREKQSGKALDKKIEQPFRNRRKKKPSAMSAAQKAATKLAAQEGLPTNKQMGDDEFMKAFTSAAQQRVTAGISRSRRNRKKLGLEPEYS